MVSSQAIALSITLKELGRVPIFDGERRLDGHSSLIPYRSWEIFLLDSKVPFVQEFFPCLTL